MRAKCDGQKCNIEKLKNLNTSRGFNPDRLSFNLHCDNYR